MLDQNDDSQDEESAIEASRLTDDEKRFLMLYREMSDIDRRYIAAWRRCFALPQTRLVETVSGLHYV